MNNAEVAITLDQSILDQLDELISRHLYPNRSRAIADAIKEKLQRFLVPTPARPDAPASSSSLKKDKFFVSLRRWRVENAFPRQRVKAIKLRQTHRIRG
ncbi:MAG: hypothetical protein KAI83_15705, partial [Thiomargarita sp.]|nr:hypothetical protein [Thiomargarita sp.]